jgi:hypothetical protein
MKIKLNSILAIVILCSCSTAISQSIQTTNLDGGSVVTELGLGIKVNKDSSLRRTWIVLNDPSCPIQISDAGIQTTYVEDDNGYRFRPTGSAKTSKPVRAFEVRYLLYDVFGEHLRTLSSTEVTDLSAGDIFSLSQSGSWYAPENDVSELLTVVVFVAQVRGDDGKIWRFDQKAIVDELGRIQLKVADVLEPTKDKGNK